MFFCYCCCSNDMPTDLLSVLYRCDRIPLTFNPVLVLQVRPSLLASTAAVTVVPLLPPQPTSITPSRGTFLSVRKVMSLVQGVTCFQGKNEKTKTTSHKAQMDLGTMQMWEGLPYRDAVALPAHCCGLVGVLGCDVCVCVCYISAVDVDVHRHGCSFWSEQKVRLKYRNGVSGSYFSVWQHGC